MQRFRIIDAHCHMQFPQYDSDRNEVIRRTLAAGVGMLCVGTDERSSRSAIELARQYEGIWASVGIHPTESGSISDELVKDTKVIAIGEIGLDYYHATDKQQQKEKFIDQLLLAENIRKPVIIHCRDAHDDLLQILRKRSVPGVIHSFTDTIERAKQYMELGYYIGLNAIVTFSDSYRTLIQELPLERIILETDAPYLAAVLYRGKRNEPLYIEAVGKYIADIRGISSAELFEKTVGNTKTLFGIRV